MFILCFPAPDKTIDLVGQTFKLQYIASLTNICENEQNQLQICPAVGLGK
jgi:hypothetical protein